MTTATEEVAVRCNQCFQRFTGATEEKAVRSFKGHATRKGHVNQYTVEDTSVADEEPTNIDEKRAAKEAAAAAKAEAKAAADKAKQEAAEAKAAKKAEVEAAAKAKREEREAAAAAKAAEKAKAKAEREAARAAAKAAREAPRTEPCECGCGGIPAGRKSRFLPGHDARHYSAIRKENGVKEEAATK